MTSKKHRYDIDICRLTASIMVIAMHVPDICPSDALSPMADFLRSAFVFFCRAGVPLFYMITGSLYLGREEISPADMMKKAAKLLGLFLVWAGLYIIKDQLFLHTYSSFNEIYCSLFSGHYHLWFLTSIAAAYLFLPVLHSTVHGRKVSLKYLMSLLFVVYIVKFNAEMLIPQLWHGPLTMISSNVLPIFVYMLLGYLLSKRSFNRKNLALMGILSMSLVFLSVFVSRSFSDKLPAFTGGSILPYSLMNFLTACFVFAGCRYLGEKKPCSRLCTLSSLSMGVYLIHPFFIEEIARLEAIGRIPAVFSESCQYLRFPTMLITVGIFSFLSSYIVSRIPLIKKLIMR